MDVDGSAEAREDFGLQCRVYRVDGRLQGAPPTEWIVRALRGEPRERTEPAPGGRAGCCGGAREP